MNMTKQNLQIGSDGARYANRDIRLFLWLFYSIGMVVLLDRILQLGIFAFKPLVGSVYPTTYNRSFMDFFSSMDFASADNPYQYVNEGAIYPPICYVLFSLFRRLFPMEVLDLCTVGDSAFLLRDSYAGKMLVLLFIFACILPILYMFYRKIAATEFQKLAICCAVLLSSPIIFIMDTANIALLVIALCCFYVTAYDSNNAFVRELALIALALAAAIKLYPAVLGFLLIKDKKYWAAVRSGIYFILLTVLPCFYYDGIPTFFRFLDSIQNGVNVTPETTLRVDFRNMCSAVALMLGYSAQAGQAAGSILIWPVGILFVALSFLVKCRWKSALCLTLLLVLAPGFSFYYLIGFFVIPLLLFLASKEHAANDFLYAIGFVIVLAQFAAPNSLILSLEAMQAPHVVLASVKVLMYLTANIGILYFSLLLLVDAIKSISKRHRIQNELCG